jgi:hypothetical protein
MDIRHLQFRASTNRSSLLVVAFLLSQAGLAQIRPMMLGELEVVVVNPPTSLSITADASAAPVGGSRQYWYPITTFYNQRSATTGDFRLTHCDRQNPPDSSSTSFAYGFYTITIQGHSIGMDYRDADYNDGNGQYGTNYIANADLTIYYDQGNGNFYKDYNRTQQIFGSIAV